MLLAMMMNDGIDEDVDDGGGGGNEPSLVTFSLSPLLVIVLSPFSLSKTTRPFLVDTTSVCELFNRPCA